MNDHQYLYDLGFLPCKLWDFKFKENALAYHLRYMLARTQKLFQYEGLPETIPARIFELYLQCNGFVGVFKHDGNLYASFGGLGGEPDYNYMPTIFTVSNPALRYSANLKIDQDCIIVKSDSMYCGLLPLFRRYGTMIAENELSMWLTDIFTRIQSIISASDDSTRESALLFLKHVIDGDPGIIGDSQFFENLKVLPYATSGANSSIKNLIEFEQYLKASEYNEIGLDANYNMKRETLTDSENEMNRDALRPLVDDMLACREEGVKRINEMFGTDIRVKLASAWQDNEEELELAHEIMEAEADQNEEPEQEPEQEEEHEDAENS